MPSGDPRSAPLRRAERVVERADVLSSASSFYVSVFGFWVLYLFRNVIYIFVFMFAFAYFVDFSDLIFKV